MKGIWLRSACALILTGDNWSTGRIESSSATTQTAIPTRNDLHLNEPVTATDGKLMASAWTQIWGRSARCKQIRLTVLDSNIYTTNKLLGFWVKNKIYKYVLTVYVILLFFFSQKKKTHSSKDYCVTSLVFNLKHFWYDMEFTKCGGKIEYLTMLNKFNQLDVTLWKFFIARHVSNVITFILRSWQLYVGVLFCFGVYWCIGVVWLE